MTTPRFVRPLLLASLISLDLFASAPQPSAGAADLAREIILAPQTGASREDVEIRHWQERAAVGEARIDAYERLAWAFVAKARRTLDVGYYKLAEKTTEAMDARFGPTAEARLLRGHIFHNLHRFHEAEAIARELVAERGLPTDFALLSDALMEQGKLEEAVTVLQRMVNQKPGAEAYSRIAHIRWLKGDLPGAIAAMETAFRATSPRDAESYAWILTRLSGYYLQSGAHPRALAAAESACKVAADYPPALLARGRALLAADRAADAADTLHSAAELNPLPDYQWWLADALRAAGREDQAIAVEALLKRRGEAGDPRTLALFLATRGENAELATRLAREEVANRADVFSRDALAWALRSSGDLTGADREMRLALAERTQDARLFLHAGEIARALGREDEAHSHFAKAKTFGATLTPSERGLLERQAAATAETN